MLRLKTLSIDALRGATRSYKLNFQKGRSITIIYGENGSGKSSICDAFDLLSNRKLGSLEKKGLGKLPPFWASTNRKPKDIKVELVAHEGTWSAQVSKGSVNVSPEQSVPRAKVLRRHQVLDLIASRPGERYDTLRPFIEIEAIDKCEDTLRTLVQSVGKDLESARTRTSESLVALESVWAGTGNSGPFEIDWAAEESSRDASEFEVPLACIGTYQSECKSLSSRVSDLTLADKSLDDARVANERATKELELVLASNAEGSAELTELLTAAEHFFEKHEQVSTCPLCGSSEYAAGLREQLRIRLQTLSAIRTAFDAKKASQSTVDRAEERVSGATQSAGATAERLHAICASEWHPSLPPPTPIVEFVVQLKAVQAHDKWQLGHLNELFQYATQLGQSLEPVHEQLTTRRAHRQTVTSALKQYQHNLQQQTELEALKPRLEKAHSTFVDERRMFVDELLSAIAERVGVLYEAIHPGEGLSKITLLLDPDKRASLELVSVFPGVEDAPPGAYLSESHLDTLGVCIYIALAELESPEETILVMDDVIASVDEPHVDRIVEMLYDVSKGFGHCVLTTHYQAWREKYRWGLLKRGECQFVTLGDWSWKEGIAESKAVPRIDLLRTSLESSDPDASEVCHRAGVVLEAVLDFLTLQFECPVPRKRTKFTLGDLLPAVGKKLRAALRIEMRDQAAIKDGESPQVQLGPMLDQIEKFAQARNVLGCHFNEMAQHVPEQDGIEFGRAVLEFADAVVHPEDGWPGSDRSGEYWANSGDSRRLRPLQRPS